MPPQNTYDTKKIVIAGIIVLLLAASIGFLIIRKKNQDEQAAQKKNLFPFGNGAGIPGSATGTGTTDGQIPNPVPQNPLTVSSADRLRIVANYPVTGFYPFVQNKVVSEPKLDEKTGQSVLVSRQVPTNYVRFNAKQNGLLVDGEITKDSIVVSQKTSTQVPGAEEIWFGSGGNSVVYRSWNNSKRTIESFLGKLPYSAPLAYCQKPFVSILKSKSRGDEVKELQKYANARLSLGLATDGSYGKKMAAAIKPLQKMLGIKETGTYDQETVSAINADCASIQGDWNRKNEGVQKLEGSFLPGGIARGTASPDGTQIFFLRPTDDGVNGYVAQSDGTGARKVFSSPMTEWRPQWINASTIAMTTLASREADGYLYFLDVPSGNFRKIMGPIRGLTTSVNPSGTMVLASQSTNKGFVLGTYSVTTGEAKGLDLVTLPEKCAWVNESIAACAIPRGIPDGQYPDDWYQGNVMFNDSFWLIDTSKGNTTNLFSEKDFDGTSLATSPDAAYLYFINRIDGTLWSYRLEE